MITDEKVPKRFVGLLRFNKRKNFKINKNKLLKFLVTVKNMLIKFFDDKSV